ncbi:DNA primase family protein [Mesonia sp.]|uniref:DNA primase family protein n=1 Tax=Mesonia sp. TaxID=1960830 RepID=UPI003F99BFEB
MKKDTFKRMVSADVENQAEKTEIPKIDNSDILNKLLENIKKVDFQLLAYPDVNELREEIEKLKPLIKNEDGSFNTENEAELKEFQQLSKKLNSYKVGKNHFLILVVEQLLKIAQANKWGLCKKNGFIYLYNGSYWTEIDKEQFQFFLGKVALKMGVNKFKGKIHTFKDDLYKQFLSDAYLPTPKTDKKSVFINLQNGTFEISPKKRGLREFRQKDFITHQLPFEYEPEAKAPLFQKYLDEVLPDPEKQKVLAEYLGYIFIRPSVLKLEKMLILYGTGANGKSVLFEIVNALLGIENVTNISLQSLTNENGYYRAKIANKLVNYASEINGKMESDIFKQMASGEPVEARLPYGDPFTLYEYAKLIFNCNTLPHDVEHTNAFFRRFLIMGFDVTIPEEKQDKELSQKIIGNELSGVFNWILQGLERLLKQKKFSKCKAIENALGDYKKDSDSVKMFIDEFEYKNDPETYTPVKELYNQYRPFCMEDGFRPVNKSNFMKRLRHHKIIVERKSGGYVAYVFSNFKGF